MSRGRGLRRFVLPLIVVALSLPSTVAAMGARTATREHCEAMGHDCAGQVLKACCCLGDESTPANPASVPGNTASTPGLEVTSTPVPAFLAAPIVGDELSHAASLDHSPPHGYQPADLSVFLSVFLI